MPETNGVPELPKDSWLYRAYDYARVRSKLPDSTIFWTLMSYCGAALQDTVVIKQSTKPIFANLPLMIVAPSGRGKTGAINVIEPIFQRFLPLKLSEDSTAESMAKDMASQMSRTSHGNSCGLWVIPELADVCGKKDYQGGIFARITRLLDAPKDRSVSRVSNNAQPIQIPGHCVLTWIAGTTFEWLQNYVDGSVSSGGFLPRLIVHYSDEGAKFVPNPTNDENIILQLNAELNQLVPNRYAGQRVVDLHDTEWDATYERIFNDLKAAEGTTMEPFIARRAENMLRIWLILRTFGGIRANSGEFGLAETCVKWLERQAVKLDHDLRIREFGASAIRVQNYLTLHHEISFSNLSKNLDIPSRDLKPILYDLRDCDIIEWRGETGNKGVIRYAG